MSWYLREGNKPVGPFEQSEIKAKLLGGQLEPDELLWKDGDARWELAINWPEFRALAIPALQEVNVVPEGAVVWTVLKKTETGHKMLGPYSLLMIRHELREQKLSGNDYLWKKGMTGWARIALRPEQLISDGSEIPSPL